MTDFCHLHTHSEFSILDGFTNVSNIPKIAYELGQNAVGITDHGSLSGSLRFWKAGREQGIKTIIGMEGYVTPDLTIKDKDTPTWHLVLLAMNMEGLHNLFAISGKGWTDGFYRKPRVDYQTLHRHNDGIIALSACMAGETARAIEQKDMDKAKLALERYRDIFGDRFYVELQPGNTVDLNSSLAILADDLGLTTVVTVDSHYDTCDRKSTQELLLVMQQTAGFKQSEKALANFKYEESRRHDLLKRLDVLWPNRGLRFDAHDLYLMSRTEVVDRMSAQGFDGNFLADRTLEIAERCEQIQFELGKNYLPKVAKRFDSDEYLRALTFDGLEDKGLHKDPRYIKQAEKELAIFKEKGFADYFLIVWDLINEARNRGIYVGPGRGSAAGSVVAFALKITAIDPIKYGLLFFRFINPERNDYPDIDMDFEHRRRDEMKEYIREKYGEALSLSTFTTLKSKSLIRSIARALCIPLAEVDAVCKQFNDLDEFELVEGTAGFRQSHPEILPLAQELEGHISASGMHAAAVVVADRPMSEIVPIETRTDPQDKKRRVPVCAYEMEDAAEVGLIKFDFLGLVNLTVIHDCIDLIRERHGITIDWEHLEPNDPGILAELGRANTVGVFQMESSPYRKLLSAMGVDSFNDLVASNALIRPGAFNTVAQDYINRKFGREKVSYPHPSVEKYLNETYGVYIYQEQIMQLAVELGDFSWAEADKLRKIIGKKKDAKEFLPFYEKWLNNAGEKIGREKAEEMFHHFEAHSNYSFNKSHAVCYSYIGYVTAYLKLRYPIEYLYAILKSEKKDTSRMTYLLEARRLGINVLPPDVNRSHIDISIDGDALRFGLSDIKGVGTAACEEIIAKRPFVSWDDFEGRIAARKCNSRVVESLVAVDAFSSVPGAPRHPSPEKNYQEYLSYPVALNIVADMGIDYTPIEDVDENDYAVVVGVVKAIKRTNTYVRLELEDMTGNMTCFGSMTNDLSEGEVVIAIVGDNSMLAYTRAEVLEDKLKQKMHLTEFEQFLVNYDEMWNEYELLWKLGIDSVHNEKSLVVPIHIRPVTTKAGKRMAFAYVADRHGEVRKLILFPAVWEKIYNKLSEWEPVCLKIQLLNDGGSTVYSNGIISADDLVRAKRKEIYG